MEIPAIMTYEQEKEEKLKLAREKLKQFRRLKKEREIPTANDPSPPPLNIAPSSDGTYQTHCNSQEAANASFLPPYPEYVPLPVLPAGSFYDTSHSPATASSMHLQDLPPPIQPQQTLVEQPQQNLAEQPQQTLVEPLEQTLVEPLQQRVLTPGESEDIKRQYEIYCQTLSHQVSSLQETVSQSQIIHKEEIEKIKNSYEDRINDLSSSIQIYVSEKSELSLELEKTRKESVSQKEGIKSLEGKIEELISTKAGEFEDTKKLEIKEEEVKVLQKELSDVNETVINQKHELSEITSKFKSKVDLAEDFERKYVDTKAQLEMTELNLSQMRNGNRDDLLLEKDEEISKLNSEIESKDKRVSELTAYIQQSNGERDQIINQYTSYSQQLVAQIEALNKTLNEKLEENSRLKESEKSLLSNVLTLENRLQELMTQQAESEKLKSESLSVVENVEDMKCKMNDLQEMHDQLEKEKGLLVAQCDDQENKIQELSIALEESLSKMSSMETEMEMLRSNFETAPLNSNINLMESMESDKVAASRAMSQNQELKEQLMELQSALVNLTNAKAELMNELDDLKRQNSFLEQCTKESEGVKSIFEEKNRTIKTLSDQLKMLIHQHEQQQTQQKKLETEQMDPDVHKLSEENRNLIQKLEESKKEILSLESANADLKGQINYNQFNRGTPQMGLSCTSTTTPSSMSSDASYVHVEVPDVEVNAVTESKIESVNDPPTEREIHSPEISSSSSSSSKTTSSSAVEVIHVEEVEEPSRMKLQQSFKNDVPNLEMDVAHFKLQQKFHDAMKKIADLMNEKDYLEHIVVQLQEETETVGEYITLYQYQRSMQKKNLEDKEKQLQKVCRDREELMSKLEKLQKLLTHFVEDKDDNDKENKVPIVNRPKIPSGSLQEEFNNERSIDQNTNIPHVHSVPSSYVVENEDNTIESKETANKILSLLNEIGTNKALNDEFRPWFWGTEAGALITI
ncbi:uncharacterized protein [Lepeophtheirus salmonis]|uniref:uncharacterized protein n=1 Tax=Lepeophtheirus salmonis TaxID=72036 RepID=UPI001AE9D1C9|nr:golgin subfamily A member 2-like [Lepeophtheirus salmonis]